MARVKILVFSTCCERESTISESEWPCAVILRNGAFDPYPFILLNLMLSTVAAIQAPFILMSQNRQSEKDRLKADQNYEVSLKIDLELQLLHEKLNSLLMPESKSDSN